MKLQLASTVRLMDLRLLPEPDEPTQRAVARALAGSGAAPVAGHEAYASRWRLAGLAESVGAGPEEEEAAPRVYGCSPRSMRGVTRA